MAEEVTTADGVVQAARHVIGTPFRHCGREPGVAMDCGGLIVYVASLAGLAARGPCLYSRFPSRVGLGTILDRHLWCDPAAGPLGSLRAGSVAGFWWDVPCVVSHCAIVADRPLLIGGSEMTIIHSFAMGARQVIEVPLDRFWIDRLVRVWDIPGIEGARWRP